MASTVRKKWLRIFGITGICLLVLLGGLHLWFSRNAARYLEGIVASQSKGALQLKVKGFSFNYFTGYMEVRQGSLTSLDTTLKPATYNIRLDRLTLHLQSFWPLLVHRQLLLDSMLVYRPHVEIYRWRKDPALQRDLVSLPSELGRLYQSLLDGLDAMQLKRITVEQAGFTVYNKMRPERSPVHLKDVNFSLNYRPDREDSVQRDAYMPGVQNVSLLIPKQSIVLPDGKHQLSFRQIELELFRRRLQLEDCTIATVDGTQKKAQFNLFFKKLLLTGVDFDALYRQNLVRADSVFCLAPMFRIAISGGVRKDSATLINTPDLQAIMKDVAGNFDLKFVGVKEGGFNVALNGAKKRTLSNERRDDFSFRGLRINPDSTEPLTVQGFDMNVRGYRLYNEDSSTAFHFDSVQLRNSRLVLRQFSVTTTARSNPIHSIRRYRIPYFELEGIDWPALLFDDRLVAQNATLIEPDIYLKAGRRSTPRKRVSLFDALQMANSQVSLKKITVRNGQLHLLPVGGTEIKLTNADLVLQTGDLLKARNEAGIKQSIEQLRFDRGEIKTGDATVQLLGMHFTESGGLLSDKLLLNSKGAQAQLSNVSLRDVVFDKEARSIAAHDLHWQGGVVRINGLGKKNSGNGAGTSISFSNISGANTDVFFQNGPLNARARFKNISAAAVNQPAGGKASFSGLSFVTGPISVSAKDLQANAASVQLGKDKNLEVKDLNFLQTAHADSLSVQAGHIKGKADLALLFGGKMQLEQLTFYQPKLHLKKFASQSPPARQQHASLHLASLKLVQPELFVSLHKGDSISSLQLPQSTTGMIELSGVAVSSQNISVEKIILRTGPAWATLPNGTRLGTERGSTSLVLSRLRRVMKEGKPDWSGTLDSINLVQPNVFVLGKGASRLTLSEASGGNLVLQGTGFGSLLKHGTAWMRTGTGTYRDSTTVMAWEGARYDAARKTLSLDTFSVRPALSREVLIAITPYQIDYVTFTSGPVLLTGFDREKLEKDSAFSAAAIRMQRPVITVYRDKRPPFRKGIIKPLPVNAIKNIRMPIDVGQVVLQNGLVVYTELAERSNEEGIISLTNLNAVIQNIRNRNLRPSDSLLLRMDALLLDSAQLSLNVKESYTDSLAGFLMHLRMKPTSLTFLNPVVAPLASVQIESGTVDSLYLNAIGREYIALGEMHLFYRNLRIKFVQVGENNRSKVLLRAMTMLANTFIIRKNNNGRKSLVYFERLRDRSFFNYVIKMTMNGLASGVGAKSNKKALRKYRKDLEQLQVRPFSNEKALEGIVEAKE